MAFMDIRADLRQTRTLSPRLQHAVRLLQMSSLDFAAMVRNELGRNPFLELEEGDEAAAADADAASPRLHDGEAGMVLDAPTGAMETSPPVDAGADGTTEAAADGEFDASGDRDLWQADAGSGVRRSEDGEVSALDMMTAETSLYDHLHRQLNVLPLGPRDLTLGHVIIESLDDDGYLRTPLEELLGVAELDPPATLEEMQIALRRVQSFEPAGVAARSVGECLLLQLPSVPCPRARGLATTIVRDHLPALAARDVAGLARRLGETPAYIDEVCHRIRRLDPRPGWRLGSSQVNYVVPDVIVRKIRGEWGVHLNPAVVPRVRLNQVYEQLFQRHRTEKHAEMGAHLQEARWTLRNVEQRFSTILDVATAIVRFQRNFFEYGPMAMKPLGLRAIADEVGVHESTVSRVTSNKFMATPLGVFELKHFFSRAMVIGNGSACSGTAIRGLIKDIIEAEPPEQPISDAEITRQLAQQGLVVARRTVTKYRQMLKIESVERRRRHA